MQGRRKLFCVYILSIQLTLILSAQNQDDQVYEVDISGKRPSPVMASPVKLGSHINQKGNTLGLTGLYFTKDGEPWFPVMGEFHFARYQKEHWEESLLKMKAAGIEIIASYIFWIYHEEEEGTFNWSGNNDLRYFAQLCAKHQLFFFPRIGPWCHGEARHGGFPDWIAARKGLRTNDANYLESVNHFYKQIGAQLNQMYFKDNGPVIGVQIENEYNFKSPEGFQHLLTLKRMAIAVGMDVPYYTATGWPASNQQQDEFLPVWGGYPEAPWDPATKELPLNEGYIFGDFKNDPYIGNDIISKNDRDTADLKSFRYPFATAEMGGGNQITYHRRPQITAADVVGLTYTKLGCGANLLGYYMFHGGSHPIGKYSTMQESRATGYPSDYPIKSYDFLAPIGEWGQLRASYHQFRLLHVFLNDFGHLLAPTSSFFPSRVPKSLSDDSTLRFSARAKGNSGFVIVNNYQRRLAMKDINGVQFSLRMSNDSVSTFPSSPITIKSGTQAIFPFNMQIDELHLHYATAQLFCRLDNDTPTYVFVARDGIKPEFSLNAKNIKELKSDVDLKENEDHCLFTVDGENDITDVTIQLKNNKSIKIIIISSHYASDLWKAATPGNDYVFVSKYPLQFSNEGLTVKNLNDSSVSFLVYPALPNTNTKKIRPNGYISHGFQEYIVHRQVSGKPSATIRRVTNIGTLAPVKWGFPHDDRKAANTSVKYPGLQYQTYPEKNDRAEFWEIAFRGYSHPDLSAIFLQLEYTGDTGSFYKDGKIIADDFYSGEPVTIGLSSFFTNHSGKLLFQRIPTTEGAEIYLSPAAIEKLEADNSTTPPSISIIPQYKATLNWK